MQSSTILLVIVVFLLSSELDLRAGRLAGVTILDTLQVGSTTLVLNGLGLRNEFVVKVHVSALYLEQKSSDADAIIKGDSPKCIVMYLLHTVNGNQMVDAFDESFKNNAPEASKSMKPILTNYSARLNPSKMGTRCCSRISPAKGPSSY